MTSSNSNKLSTDNKRRYDGAEAIKIEMNQPTQMNKTFEVTSHYKKAGAVVMDRFSTQTEALAFARDATDTIEPEAGDTLVSVTVTNQSTKKVLSTFYPDFYEAESLDDDDDG